MAVVRVRGEKDASWKVMENAGEKTSTYEECGSIFPVRDRKQRSFERMPREKSRKGYKPNGSANRRPMNT